MPSNSSYITRSLASLHLSVIRFVYLFVCCKTIGNKFLEFLSTHIFSFEAYTSLSVEFQGRQGQGFVVVVLFSFVLFRFALSS